MTTIVSLLNLGLNFLLIPWFGAEGAALASLFSQAIFFFGIYYFSNREYPIRYEWRKVTLIFITGLILVYSALLTNDLALWVRLIAKSTAIALFPVILYFLNFYEQAELNQIKMIWKNWRNPLRWKENLKRLF